jgi:hypothetical protein
MNSTFPLGFPGPTTFYLSVYVLTLVVHVVFMNYVLGGVAYILARSLFGKSKEGPNVLVDLLRDWLPFALSAAITAGIAPLLFVQVLYKKNFYTANLLLFHRWMAIVPVLIVGFYLLYVLKTEYVGARRWLFVLVTAGALTCFLFTALSWTENYLLARNESVWASMYASRAMVYHSPELLPRMLLWSVGAFPTLAMILGWQVYGRERAGEAFDVTDQHRVSRLGLFGLIAAGGCAAVYAVVIGKAGQTQATSPLALPWLIVAVVGAVVQGLSWMAYRWSKMGKGTVLGIVTAGLLATILGMTCVREVLRITAIDFAGLYADHARAAQVGGRYLFLGFFVVNAVLAGWAIRVSLKGAAKAKPSEE